jgi:hypothetical protein
MAVFWYDVIRHLLLKVGGAKIRAQKSVDVPGIACHNGKQIVGDGSSVGLIWLR